MHNQFMVDKIHIRDLDISCIIGTNAWERENKQPVIINVEMFCDLTKPGRTDQLEDTVDYKALKDRIIEEADASKYYLIERLADHVAAIVLGHPMVREVSVTVDKPGALTGTRSVAVEIHRVRT